MSERDKAARLYSNRTLEMSYGGRLRFGLAAFLRCSERIVEGLVSRYERMCALDETDVAEIYETMGEDFARRGSGGEAASALESALSLRPSNVSARFQLGIVYVEEGKPDKAVDEFRRAIEDGMDCFELHFYLGDCLAEIGRHDDAVGHLGRAIEHQPESAEAHYRLGTVLDILKRFADAVAAFERAVEVNPREPTFHQSLGFAHESMGNRDEAIRCFKHALVLERRAGR